METKESPKYIPISEEDVELSLRNRASQMTQEDWVELHERIKKMSEPLVDSDLIEKWHEVLKDIFKDAHSQYIPIAFTYIPGIKKLCKTEEILRNNQSLTKEERAKIVFENLSVTVQLVDAYGKPHFVEGVLDQAAQEYAWYFPNIEEVMFSEDYYGLIDFNVP